MTKNFIIDTNVLLSDPTAILKFEDNNVIVPLVVLEELDKQKSSDREIARDARAVVRKLNEIIQDKDVMDAGVDLETGGKLFVYKNVAEELQAFEPTCNDDHIINIAIAAQEANPDDETALVSNDVCMRLKAKGAGLKHAQEFRSDVVVDDPELLPKGFVEIPDGWLATLDPQDVIQKSCGETHIHVDAVADVIGDEAFGVNDWLVNENDGIAARLDGQTEDEDFLIFTFENVDQQMLARNVAGIRPRDVFQAIAFDAILDKDIDIVVLDGMAGCGKTLLAMAGATELVKGKKTSYRMEEVIFTRSNDTQFKEVGFLPGSEHGKMAPWLMGCIDNMEVIARESKNKKFHPSMAIAGDEPSDDAFITFKALNFMRGRSINHKVLIIDEFQNLTASQAKTILSRCGEYTKCIIMGNLGQIDSQFVSPRTSGLTYATEKLHGQPFAKVLCLQEVQRSRLADYVEKNF